MAGTVPTAPGALTFASAVGAPKAGAPAPWNQIRRVDRREGYRFAKADYAAARVPVKADLGPILAMLGKGRKLQGLGFRDPGVTSVTLSAAGPGIAPEDHVHADVPLPTDDAGTLRPTNPTPLATLAVPAGRNRLFMLEAKDAAGAVLARLRAVADVETLGAAMTIDFTYQSDAAGRVLEDLLFYMEPGVAEASAFVQSLATTSYGAALNAYIGHFTGYDGATNQFSGVNPVYFKDWVLATQLVADADGGARLTDASFPNPGEAGTQGDLTLESRAKLHVSLQSGEGTPADGSVTLFDPIDRGAGNTQNVADGAEWVDDAGRFASVPPGRWLVRATAGETVVTTMIDIPQTEGAADYEVHLNLDAGVAGKVPAAVKTPPPPPPVPFAMHEVRTYTGSTLGSANGPLGSATFNGPRGMAFDGMDLLVADTENNLFRKITANGHVETLAGNFGAVFTDDVPPDQATFSKPWAVSAYPGHVILAEMGFQRWRDLTLDEGVGFMVHDKVCCFGLLRGMAARPSDGHVFTIDDASRLIQEWDATGGLVREFQFGGAPLSLAMDAAGDMYVGTVHDAIFKVSPTLSVQHVAGVFGDAGSADGPPAHFNNPEGLAASADGHRVWVADTGNHTIRQLTINASGNYDVTTIAGTPGVAGTTNGVGTTALFNSPAGLAYDGGQFLYVADTGNHRIRKIRVQ